MIIKEIFHHLIIAVRGLVNRLIPIPLPELVTDKPHQQTALHQLSAANKKQVFVVTDKALIKLGLIDPLLEALKSGGINVTLFDQVTPDPTTQLVEQGRKLFSEHQCDAVISVGGGSVIDCAKAIVASAIKNKPISALSGLFKVRQKLPLFIAIPTTAGTGSETTVVAVITNAEKKQKFTVIDPVLVPDVAILDAALMVGLPPKITAETGIDALTHAIESYIGCHAYGQTKAYALTAMEKIFSHLQVAYDDGANLLARKEMALASFYAGAAFTRTSIGYVHAIAHQLGGYYHIPHGLANAVLLPHILEFSFEQAKSKLAELAIALNFAEQGTNDTEAARRFVHQVQNLLTTLNIPSHFNELERGDISLLAGRAVREAYGEYPVPRYMTQQQCQQILTRLLVNK